MRFGIHNIFKSVDCRHTFMEKKSFFTWSNHFNVKDGSQAGSGSGSGAAIILKSRIRIQILCLVVYRNF
jgi:hypothetical protein